MRSDRARCAPRHTRQAFLCPPKRAMRSDLFTEPVVSTVLGRFYALRSGLCVATWQTVVRKTGTQHGFYALRSGLCVATNDSLAALRQMARGFYALRSGLCVATLPLVPGADDSKRFLCPPKRAMRSDGHTRVERAVLPFLCPPKRAMCSDSMLLSRVTWSSPCFYALRSGLCVATSRPPIASPEATGFYALRSGLCVATSWKRLVWGRGNLFLCPPKRAMRSDAPIGGTAPHTEVSMPSEAGYA